jgi:hypothetical protein
MAPPNPRDVFVNCPFDAAYKPVFHAIVFTVIRCGFRVRCALEADDAAENRFGKICGIIDQCRYGVHDISRTESDGDPPLPRFNMPLELGLFLGAKRYGGKVQKDKKCIIFDREPYRYQRFMSDIAGQDIHIHRGDEAELIRELSAWFRTESGLKNIPGGAVITADFNAFWEALPNICAARGLILEEMTFSDYNDIVVQYLTV